MSDHKRGRPRVKEPRKRVLQIRVTEAEYIALVKHARQRKLAVVVRDLIQRGLQAAKRKSR